MPWVCIGDFNKVLRYDEHEGIGQRSQAQIQGFRDAVHVCGMIDLGYQGHKWTFEKKVVGGSYTRVRLDKALGSPEWYARFPLAAVEHLAAVTSDHSPILLKLDPLDRGKHGKKKFRYECMWDTHPELIPTVQHAWEANRPNLRAVKVRENSLSLSNNLGKWSKSAFGSVKAEIRRLEKELERLRNDPLRTAPSHAEIKTNDRLIELYLHEEIMWFQRSRVNGC
ncbi:uncharacterized protein [Aegilops tauschii subsp. strangulata]|uniref:uncharacterized protein n=1 Tax=Aegilops tauschii subsp. strangulata TaxID=200361 RepID=UPI003CC8E03F